MNACQKACFKSAGKAPPTFELMSLRLNDGPVPTLPNDWDDRVRSFGPGLTVVHTGQCPYTAGSVQAVHKAAEQLGLEMKAVELKSSELVRKKSPSAYGVFGVTHDGALVSYHPIGTKDLLKRLEN